jgi:Xaa-Pro aminopeptidase
MMFLKSFNCRLQTVCRSIYSGLEIIQIKKHKKDKNYMYQTPQSREILGRIENLHNALNSQSNEWTVAFIVDKVNQYYLTGTMQDGVFILRKDGSYAYFVRNSYERAKQESSLENIYPMKSYRDAAEKIAAEIGTAFVETEVITFAMLERLKKYFQIENIVPVDRAILGIRAVKSPYEIACMEESGRQHKILLENIVPGLLKAGINEAELTAQIYAEMVNLGYHGVSRFSMFQTECVIGQLGFGENSLFPTYFDGPGGMKGMCPAVPIIGDRSRVLKKSDLVFVDIGYGFNGYHTDRTQIYSFGATPQEEVTAAHRECMRVQKEAAAKLKPGAIPSQIYESVGFTNRNVRFLGHGVGLYIDEFPVIASGFDTPLQENMTIALEPKMEVSGVGIAGVEDTYVVTKDGGKCLTGGEKDIMVVQ